MSLAGRRSRREHKRHSIREKLVIVAPATTRQPRQKTTWNKGHPRRKKRFRSSTAEIAGPSGPASSESSHQVDIMTSEERASELMAPSMPPHPSHTRGRTNKDRARSNLAMRAGTSSMCKMASTGAGVAAATANLGSMICGRAAMGSLGLDNVTD